MSAADAAERDWPAEPWTVEEAAQPPGDPLPWSPPRLLQVIDGNRTLIYGPDGDGSRFMFGRAELDRICAAVSALAGVPTATLTAPAKPVAHLLALAALRGDDAAAAALADLYAADRDRADDRLAAALVAHNALEAYASKGAELLARVYALVVAKRLRAAFGLVEADHP